MNIISIEERAYQMMIARVQTLADRVEEFCESRGDKSLKKWLDNQDVCDILNVSKRTLQSYQSGYTWAAEHCRIGVTQARSPTSN